jgi:hypothetical protein
MNIVNQKEIDEWKNNPIGKPPRPILSERPGLTYQLEGVSFFKKRTIHTKQVFENGVWVEYDKESGKITGRVFE